MLQTISWTGSAVRLLDQTKLPTETVYVDIVTEQQMHDAIRRLVVRGAPAIGVAAAFGAYLAVRNARADDGPLPEHLRRACDYLATARPTAVNLTWALKRIERTVSQRDGVVIAVPAAQFKQRILEECLAMLEEDRRVCRAIGEHGLELLRSIRPASQTASMGPFNILTHCNAGALATVAYGTALSPIYVGAEQGEQFHVFVDETRPLLQGSRITAFELMQNNIPCTLICDNMAASVMNAESIDAVIVGADRIAANGDVANKIGTLGVAILARHFGIPFFVAAPTSTIDPSIPTGSRIPIEHRDPAEVTGGGSSRTAPPDVAAHNPAFDVTPAVLVGAIITERGLIRAPYETGITEILRNS